MKKSILFFLTLSISIVSFQAFSASRVIIENATLIDAATSVRENMTIILQGDEIKSIEKSNSTNIYITNKDSVIDATGKFLIPGLWDAHVHLTFIPELDYETAYKLFLMNGITSIRDTGAVLKKLQPAIDFANENPHITPRVFFSGPLIDGNPKVLSLGGGAFLNSAIRRKINKLGLSIWISPSLETIYERLNQSKNKRPLLNYKNLKRSIKEIYDSRKEQYNKANYTIRTKSDNKKNIVKKIIEIL